MVRRAHACLGLIALGLCLAAPAHAQADGDWKPETFTLDNGMQAVVLPDHRAPVVTHMLWYRVGSADEVKGKSGLAHFLEHLMFKATSTTEAGAFSRTVARNGGQDNAGTSFDFTNYHFRIAKDRLPLMMRMEADRMANLQLAEDEVLPERSVVQEERRQVVESNPSAILDEKVWAKLYAGHPYSVPVIGYMEDVAGLTRTDALDWYRTWYGPENAILVIAGDITAAELKPLAEQIYGQVGRRGDLRTRKLPPVSPLAQSAEVSHSDPKVRQITWSRNWLGVSLGHPDAAALQVGVQVLGGGRTSRLYRDLIEGGKAVQAVSYSYELEARGPLAISVSPAPGVSVDEIKAAAMKTLDTFLWNGPTEEELDRAKKMIAANDVFRRDNQMDMVNWYGGMLTAGMTLGQIEAMDDAFASVTAEQVRAAMNKYMSGVNHVDALLLPVTR